MQQPVISFAWDALAEIGSHGCSFNGHQLKRVPFQVSNIRVGSNCVGYYIYLSVTLKRGPCRRPPSFFPGQQKRALRIGSEYQ